MSAAAPSCRASSDSSTTTTSVFLSKSMHLSQRVIQAEFGSDYLLENSEQSRTLVTMRDTLLPKMPSGEESVGGTIHKEGVEV